VGAFAGDGHHDFRAAAQASTAIEPVGTRARVESWRTVSSANSRAELAGDERERQPTSAGRRDQRDNERQP
jgi:hypothetical protein